MQPKSAQIKLIQEAAYWLVCFMRTARSKEVQKIIFLAGSPLNSKKDVVNLSLGSIFFQMETVKLAFSTVLTAYIMITGKILPVIKDKRIKEKGV